MTEKDLCKVIEFYYLTVTNITDDDEQDFACDQFFNLFEDDILAANTEKLFTEINNLTGFTFNEKACLQDFVKNIIKERS